MQEATTAFPNIAYYLNLDAMAGVTEQRQSLARLRASAPPSSPACGRKDFLYIYFKVLPGNLVLYGNCEHPFLPFFS